MAATADPEVLKELKAIRKEVAKFSKIEKKVDEIEKEVINVKGTVDKHSTAIYGDQESLDLEKRGIFGAIIKISKDMENGFEDLTTEFKQSNAKYITLIRQLAGLFIALISGIALIVAAIIEAGGISP